VSRPRQLVQVALQRGQRVQMLQRLMGCVHVALGDVEGFDVWRDGDRVRRKEGV
jgi:hypothetical protein